MKIIDCFMYYDEDMVLDIRLNILNKYVSHFIICEANFNHKLTKREFLFDINKFSKFREKIIYLQLNDKPQNLKELKDSDSNWLKIQKFWTMLLKEKIFSEIF